jgi:N-hydroxyarylamine O-acetyltransferase
VFDLDSYLLRIGLQEDSPGLAAVHRAHVTSIPFETLGPLCGESVSLEEDELAGKLVEQRRGGYCFEQNLLLKASLEALGAEVELYLARGLLGADPDAPRPRTHLLLGVHWEGEHWHADAGFGGGTLLEPLPWGPGEVHEQAGWRYRVIERHPEYVLQTAAGEAWGDLYAFIPHPVPKADIETANWWTSTHPDSRFKNGFLVSRQWSDGRRLALSDWGELSLTERTAGTEHREPVSDEQIPRLLADRFGLPGFVLGEDGRIARAEQARR